MPEISLSDWIIGKLRDMNLSQNELARRAGISTGAMSRYINGRVPDTDACRALARVFSVDEEFILKLAGHLETERGYDAKRDELNSIVDTLGSEDQNELLEIARMKARKAKKK